MPFQQIRTSCKKDAKIHQWSEKQKLKKLVRYFFTHQHGNDTVKKSYNIYHWLRSEQQGVLSQCLQKCGALKPFQTAIWPLPIIIIYIYILTFLLGCPIETHIHENVYYIIMMKNWKQDKFVSKKMTENVLHRNHRCTVLKRITWN